MEVSYQIRTIAKGSTNVSKDSSMTLLTQFVMTALYLTSETKLAPSLKIKPSVLMRVTRAKRFVSKRLEFLIQMTAGAIIFVILRAVWLPFFCGNGRVFNPVTLLCEEDQGEGCQPVCNPDSAPIDNSTDKSSDGKPALLWSMVVLGILIVGGVAFLCFISRDTISEKFQAAKNFSKKGTKDRDVTSEGNTRRDSPVVNPAYEEDIKITGVKPSKSKPAKSKPVQDPQASGSSMDNPDSVNSKGNKSYLSRANLFKFKSPSPSETQA